MSKSFVHRGGRRTFTPTVVNKAGDLVWQGGFFGVLQDDAVVGRMHMMILEGVQELKNVYGSNINPGTKVHAAPSVMATSLQLFPAASAPSTNWPAIGKAWATSPASSATATLKVALFNVNEQ